MFMLGLDWLGVFYGLIYLNLTCMDIASIIQVLFIFYYNKYNFYNFVTFYIEVMGLFTHCFLAKESYF